MDSKFQQRMALYNQGLNDHEIARAQGADPSSICHWRHTKGLKSHYAGSVRNNAAVSIGRRFLYDLNWGDKSIAWQQNVSDVSVRKWRRAHRLPANRPKTRTYKRDKLEQLHELQRRVTRAIGTRLPFDIAADAASDLMLAVIEGRVPMDQIEKQGRAFGNRALQQYANAFVSRSLDEDIAGTDGMKHIDMLRDETCEEWLDEMGASFH